jgi:glycosyltransferase involved in cell wall biosynthesis
MALFSIIVPVYNVENWLARCLDSILSDRCTDMEIILVDDGSTDSSGKICDRYATSHTNVSVIHKENGGLSSARNAGLEQASGEWVSFIDSDDWVDKDSFYSVATILAQLGETKPDMVKFGYKRVGGDKIETRIPCVSEGIYNHDEIIRELLPTALGSKRISNSTVHTFVLSAWAHIYRHEFLRETGMWFTSERKVGSEDFLYVNSLYMQASCVYVSHAAWYYYDTREGSLTRKYRKDLFTQYKYLGALLRRELEDADLGTLLLEDFNVFYIGLMYICIMNECVPLDSHLNQVRRVKNILKDDSLRKCLRGTRFSDLKSKLLAGFMRTKLALPLCVIQWRGAEKPS